MNRNLYAVILAGGGGTRLWPLSRASRPKFLLRVGKRSLLRQTVDRLKGLVPPSRIRIVCGRGHVAAIRRDWPSILSGVLMAEPIGRNTAAAIGWAAHAIARRDPDALVVFMPADHLIENPARFRKIVRQGCTFLKKNDRLLTLGMKPDRPETGYGYLEVGPSEGGGVFQVRRFVEKPPLAVARRWVKDRRHLWNAGIFLGRVGTFQMEIERWIPSLGAGLRALEGGSGGKRVTIDRVYSRLPSLSFDYGVMEKSRKVAVLPGRFGWRDVGNLEEFIRLSGRSRKDRSGKNDRVLAIDSDPLVLRSDRSEKRLLVTLGLKELMIVETADALLIADRRRPQKVREVVQALKQRGENASL